MIAFLVALLLSLFISPLVIKFYHKCGWLDDPAQRKHVKVIHSQPIPRGGGVVTYISILFSSLFFLQIDKYLLAILLAGLLIVIVGVWDDVKDLSPVLRLGTNILASLIVVGVGIGIAYVSNPFGPGVIHLNQPQISLLIFNQPKTIWLVADLLAVVFIVWNMNMINWSSGLPGQMSGLVSISSCVIGLLSTRFADDPTQFNTTLLCFITAGAYAGYLFWNWQPQRSMPGYGGSTLAGFLLAVLSILSGAKVATMLMVLAVPTADAIFTIVRRVVAGKSPFFGDRGHLHHKLIDVMGWTQIEVAIFYWGCSLLMGVLSLYLNTWQKISTMLTVFLLVFGFLVWAKISTNNKHQNNVR